jgi:alpha-L-rhamnosidase
MKLILTVYHHFFRTAVFVVMALGSVAQALEPGGLRCEAIVNPLGIDVLQPRLSWKMEEKPEGRDQNAETGGQNSKSSSPRGVRQTAYQIVVNDAWDSGKVASDASVNVEYAGKPLESGRRYTWKVRVWDQDGKPTSWSANAHWTMGLLRPEDWTAKWISTEVSEPAPASGGTLKILKATYVAKDGTGSADVTARVAAKVKDGGLSLIVQPDQLGGDPVPNHAKELRVEYEFNGKKLSAAAADFRTLTLPPRTSRVPAPLDEPYIRRTFTLDAVPRSALATVNVLGFYELYVNGARVGTDVLSPALSNYHKRSLYVTYDLLPYLRKGRNCIGLWTGRGWYWKVLDGRPNPAVKHDSAIARVQLDMVVNGKPVRIGTGPDWRCKASGRSILGTWSWNAMGGELVDARLEDPKWADPASNDASWYPVTVVPAPAIPAEAQKCPPTRVIKTLPAVDCVSSQSGRYELDFGSNLTGWLRLRMRGLKAGDEIVIRYSDKKGHAPMQLYNHEDRFISAGRPEEEFCSKFNYHGFRWALIDGLPAAPRLKDAQALALGADWESCGGFECSSKLFNRMHEVNLWTVRALSQCGFLSDCPHRERAGYGDGQVSIESCMMNFRMQNYYDKWATDWCDGADPATGYLPHTAPQYQFGGGGPAWGGAAQALTWRNYLYYDDRRILVRNYEACRRHIEAIESHAKDGIVRSFGGQWDFIGDWVPPERGLDTSNWPPKPAAEFFNNCYRLYLREQLATMADVLGRADEARACRAELERLRPLVHAAFYDKESRIYVLDEQSYQLMPLMTGVLPADLRPVILKKLEDGIRVKRKGHLDTGMLGTYFLLQYLQQTGRNDLIFEVVNQTTYPGWGHMIEQGATTWWEQWNGYWSQIHSCFTSLDGWFYQGLAGIRPDPAAPGFKKFIIRPSVVGDLTWVKAHYDSAYGRIVSAWTLEGAALVMDVAVPPNSSATVYVPAADQGAVTVAGEPAAKVTGVQFLRMEAGAAVYAVQSGRYSFRAKR